MNKNDKILLKVLKKLHTKLVDEEYVEVRGQKTIELLNQTIEFFGTENGLVDINKDFKTSIKYVGVEFTWYDSQHPHIEKIGNHASMWGMVCDKRGMVNSNYGYLIYSPQNGYQYDNVLKQLKEDPQSRRAVMYYANPMTHYTGGNDHVCTLYVSYSIRNGKLQGFVSMRSSDIRYGIIGADLAWQLKVLQDLANDLDVKPGSLHWHAVSLHLYERHFTQLKELFYEN